MPLGPISPNALNAFYARFEAANTSPSSRLTVPPGHLPLSVSEEDVRRSLQRINPRKATGPDNIPGKVLRGCAYELTEVWTDIFNISLSQAVVPVCLKTSTIIPVPKSAAAKSMNDFRPVALTPIIMKCFEQLVMVHIRNNIAANVDPHQYAYRKSRSTSDAVSSVIHTALTHLEKENSYVRLLFLDFSSAFNTIIPQTLANKLLLLGLTPSMCNWVLDFLTHRPQTVKIHGTSSSSIILNTGSPQGCVLSPLLYTLFTHDCSAKHPGCHMVKFADDTVVVGQISHNDESSYRQEVTELVDWCGENSLCINVGKTKELIVDFRTKQHVPPLPLFIHGAVVERVPSFKYLGVHISEDLKWAINTSNILKKAHQRLYFLRRLRQAGLSTSVLEAFYRCVVESTLTFSITTWYGNCTAANKKALQRVVKNAQKITQSSLPSIETIYTSRCRSTAASIMEDPTHPAHKLFDPLPSGRRLRSIKATTERFKCSFYPGTVRLPNSKPL